MSEIRSWQKEHFREDAEAWTDARLGEARSRRTGPLEIVKIRPWSAVLRVPAEPRTAYFKALCPASRHEPALVEHLTRYWPERLPRVLGVDAERAWLLTEDGGPTLRETSGLRNARHWIRALTQYAELQRETTAQLEDWLRLGVPDRRLERLPERMAMLLDDEATWCANAPECPPAADLRALRAHLPSVSAACAELGALGVPAALHHGDLHDGNVFLNPKGYCFFDWGDSSLTHPFFSLLVTLNEADIPPTDRARMIAAYIEPWAAKLSPDTCERALPLALRLAPVVRSVEWHGVLIGASEAERAEWLPHAWRWLRRALPPG